MAKQAGGHGWYEWVLDGLLLRAQHEHELLRRVLEDESTCNHVHPSLQPCAHTRAATCILSLQPCASKPATLRGQPCHVPQWCLQGARRAHLGRRGSRRRPATRRPLRPRVRRCQGRQRAPPRFPARAVRRGRPLRPPARGRSPRATRPPRPWSPGTVLARYWHGTGMDWRGTGVVLVTVPWHGTGIWVHAALTTPGPPCNVHPQCNVHMHMRMHICGVCTCAACAPCPPRRAAPA